MEEHHIFLKKDKKDIVTFQRKTGRSIEKETLRQFVLNMMPKKRRKMVFKRQKTMLIETQLHSWLRQADLIQFMLVS